MSKPLAGRTILVTRPRKQSGGLAEILSRQGARVVEVPVIEIRPPRSWAPLDRALNELQSYDWLVLTSANGVDALFERIKKLKVATSSLKRLHVAAIGPATKQSLRKHGVRVDVTPREYVAEAVGARLAKRVAGKRVLLVRAAIARDVLPERLRKAGAEVTVVSAYKTMIAKKARRQLKELFASADKPDIVTCTSSSTVGAYLKLTQGISAARKVAFASIGPITSGTLRQHGVRPAIEAKRYAADGLARAIARWAKMQTR